MFKIDYESLLSLIYNYIITIYIYDFDLYSNKSKSRLR
jgi:hypothetical protein